jgi:Ca-activated chloride channel family protein
MNRPTHRKTLAILGAAAALAGAAAFLGRPGAAPNTPPVDPGTTCAVGAPAHAAQSFGAGQMTAALSSGSVLRGSDGTVYASIDLDAADAAAAERPPMSVAIVIDHSGSMEGEPLARAKAAARGLVERLGARDHAAVVQYDSTAEVLVPAVPVDVEGKGRLLHAIDSIADRGGTNIGAGLELGRDEVMKGMGPGRVNRVILLSDGNANEGLLTVPEFARLASNAAERGVRISTVGLGDSYNEDLMQAVAEHGRGRYYYAADATALETVFAGELKSLAGTVATQTELRLTPACGAEIVEVFGYEARREGDTVIVPLADLAGGDRRKIVARVKVAAAAVGQANVLTATFSHAGAKGGERRSTAIVLGVEVTGDAEKVAQAADKDVLAKVAQVETSVTLRKAADAYASGDRGAALRMVEEQKQRSASMARDYKLDPAKMAPADKPLASFAGAVQAAPPAAEAAPSLTKRAKADAYEMAK